MPSQSLRATRVERSASVSRNGGLERRHDVGLQADPASAGWEERQVVIEARAEHVPEHAQLLICRAIRAQFTRQRARARATPCSRAADGPRVPFGDWEPEADLALGPVEGHVADLGKRRLDLPHDKNGGDDEEVHPSHGRERPQVDAALAHRLDRCVEVEGRGLSRNAQAPEDRCRGLPPSKVQLLIPRPAGEGVGLLSLGHVRREPPVAPLLEASGDSVDRLRAQREGRRRFAKPSLVEHRPGCPQRVGGELAAGR
eukprot:4704815-Pyramimonas_sp.AAC.1